MTELQDFMSIARKFCSFLETTNSKDSVKFLVQVQHQLLGLYGTAMKLPTIDLQSNVNYNNQLDNDELERVKLQLMENLDKNRFYWYVFDPIEIESLEEEVVCGDLHDDLIDIYKDLKYQLMIYHLGTKDSRENAIWSFRFYFWHHWSNHAIDAMRAVHYLIEKTERYK